MSAQRREDDLAVEPAEQTVENAAHSSASTDERPPQPGATRVGEHHRLGLADRIGNQSLSVKTFHRVPVEGLPHARAHHRFTLEDSPDRSASTASSILSSIRSRFIESRVVHYRAAGRAARGAGFRCCLRGTLAGAGPDRMLRRAAPSPRRRRPQRPGAASTLQPNRVPAHERRACPALRPKMESGQLGCQLGCQTAFSPTVGSRFCL